MSEYALRHKRAAIYAEGAGSHRQVCGWTSRRIDRATGGQVDVETGGTDMDLKIVNPRPKYGRVRLIEPPGLGYIHVSAAVEPPARGPLPGRSAAKLGCR
jgi:hypothetical protein